MADTAASNAESRAGVMCFMAAASLRQQPATVSALPQNCTAAVGTTYAEGSLGRGNAPDSPCSSWRGPCLRFRMFQITLVDHVRLSFASVLAAYEGHAEAAVKLARW